MKIITTLISLIILTSCGPMFDMMFKDEEVDVEIKYKHQEIKPSFPNEVKPTQLKPQVQDDSHATC